MFERCTENAIKVVMLAQEEAYRLGYRTVGSEHLLLGVIGLGQGSCDAHRVLNEQGIDLHICRAAVEALTGKGSDYLTANCPWYERLFNRVMNAFVERPFSEDAKDALVHAAIFAKETNKNVIDTEQLLIGILEGTSSKAIETLKRCGTEPDAIKEVLKSKLVT
jgi:ATP-dependent Clp protease ATP-binding subunit ClpC